MKRIVFLSIISALAYSCGSLRMSYNQDMSYLYKRETVVLHPEMQAWHVSDVTTDIYFSIASKELLYTKQQGEADYTSRLLISYRLTASYESKVIIDSGFVKMQDVNNDNATKLLNGKFTVKATKGANYLLKITFNDLNRNQKLEEYLDLYKVNSNTAQNFLTRSKETGSVLYRDNISAGEEVIITYKHTLQNKLFVKYYKKDFPIAAPPFSILDPRPFEIKPDSTFIVPLNDTGTYVSSFAKEGIYNFVSDTNQRDGLTLYRYNEGFPEVTRADQMLYPMRFITSKDEYDNINNSKNKKAAIESFWINCAGNQERAKEVIRKFYNRVKNSNIYFSSYLEGWKTDRGMIYLIFGPPNLVYKSTDSETWVYGEDNNQNSLTLAFNKATNPFSDNDYVLQRSTVYKSNWYRAVDIWRQGRIYLQN